MKDFKKELDKLGDYLWKQKIQPDDALKVLKKTYELSPSNYRTQWKMWRFTMYLWTRLDEKKKLGRLGPKINSIRAVVETPKYRRLWETWAKDNKKFNADKEVLCITSEVAFCIAFCKSIIVACVCKVVC